MRYFGYENPGTKIWWENNFIFSNNFTPNYQLIDRCWTDRNLIANLESFRLVLRVTDEDVFLAALLLNSFLYLDDYTGKIISQFSLRTYALLFSPTNLDIFARTTLMAALVTVAAAILGFPVAFYAARFASPRLRTVFYLAVTLPLWSSYLVRVYSWKVILAQGFQKI
jgi:ABC-type spermidine/putrescine transport system permease subunit I